MQERGTAAALSAISAKSGAGRTARFVITGVTALVAVVADQLTKTWAVRRLADRDIHLVWTLRLHLAYNSGGAFSLGGGNPWFFVVAAVVVLGLLLTFGRRLHGRLPFVAVGLILGGALGNLADRLLRDTAGSVVDFVDLQWWPVFNVADACIVCGGILLLITSRDLGGSPGD